MTSCMTLKTMIMVTRTKLLFVADIAHILYTMNTTIHAEPNVYDFHCQVYSYKQYSLIYKLDEG